MPEDESPETRLRRLHMRSWRRGMKEMDLILGPFADGPLAGLSGAELDDYEVLLEQNDQDLYRWITARITVSITGPTAEGGDIQGLAGLEPLLDRIAEFASNCRNGGLK